MNLKLNGRKAIVTGASRGIGAAIARGLAAEGVDVALFTREVDNCRILSQELINNYKVNSPIVALDLLDIPNIKAAVREGVNLLGGNLDILVNNAGGATRGNLFDVSDEAWERNFTIKPIGIMRMSRECAPYLKQSDQARIINLSGTRGREPAYQSTLSGPINMGTNSATKVLANLLGPAGITVNAICPGLVKTDFSKLLWENPDAERATSQRMPLRRLGEADDFMGVAVFLASDESSFMTGQALTICGGASMWS